MEELSIFCLECAFFSSFKYSSNTCFYFIIFLVKSLSGNRYIISSYAFHLGALTADSFNYYACAKVLCMTWYVFSLHSMDYWMVVMCSFVIVQECNMYSISIVLNIVEEYRLYWFFFFKAFKFTSETCQWCDWLMYFRRVANTTGYLLHFSC